MMNDLVSDEAESWRRIGDRLRQAREYLELKQEEAAEAVGLSRSALSLVENGRRKVDAVELARFAEVYGQSVGVLSGTAETPPLPDSVQALARAAAKLSAEDRDELLRFAEFLQGRRPRSANRG
jgi:transcriptional regulator with XRE-family HTH domain